MEKNRRHFTFDTWCPQSKPYRYSDEDEFTRIFGNAALTAMAVALFAPSLSGQSAIDRFARQHKAAGPDETAGDRGPATVPLPAC